MRASPEQPLAKGWDDILDVLASADKTCTVAVVRCYNRGTMYQAVEMEAYGLQWKGPRPKQPLAKGRPPIHTTTPKKRPLRRALTPPKGTT